MAVMKQNQISEDTQMRLGQACEMFTQVVDLIQNGQTEAAVHIAKGAIILIEPIKGMRPPEWFQNEVEQVRHTELERGSFK